MRALLHVGLAGLLILAPALCCCNVRWLAGRAVASPVPPAACPSCPAPQPVPIDRPTQKSCCHGAEPEVPAAEAAAVPDAPPAPQPAHCQCRADLPDATPPDTFPAVADPEPTGEWLPVSVLRLMAVPPEHLGLVGGLGPPERAGVDARSEALFARHVMRC